MVDTPAQATKSDTLPLATINWWIGLAITLCGVALAAAQSTLTDYAKEHPQNTTIALVLVCLGLATKWIAAHHDVILKKVVPVLALVAMLVLPGCLSSDVKNGVAGLDRDIPAFGALSQPAAGVDPAKWKAALLALAREAHDANVAANGAGASAAPASPTATPVSGQ